MHHRYLKKEGLPFDKDKIGRKVASFSGEHEVFRYGEEEVIKFPYGPIYKVDPNDAYEKIANEFRFITKYLGDFVPDSKMYTYYEDGKRKYCIIQKFVKGRALKLEDMKQECFKEELRRLIKANDEMYECTRYTLELFGVKGLIFHSFLKRMENVIVTNANELVVIDFGLISDITMISRSNVLRSFIAWAIKRQRRLLKKYLKEDAL